MPNWCENELLVTGDIKSVARFIRKSKTTKDSLSKNGKVSELSLHRLVPQPDDITKEEEFNHRWWEWRKDNWGTKWDIDCEECYLSTNLDKVEYRFLSAWSPPIEFLNKASTLFKKLRFSLVYNEPGMGYTGKYVVKSGKVITDDCFDTSNE